MKQKFIPFATMAILAFTSCHTSKEITSMSSTDFNGEWNIVEVNGSALQINEYPYIGFDNDTKRIYGNSGCNNIMGSFELNSKEGSLKLGQMASTMMAGPNMDTERNVLNALGQVKAFKQINDNEIALCNEQKRPVVILKKRFYNIPVSELNGKWNILKVYGENVPSNMEEHPFITFDTQKEEVSGNAGCNSFHGKYSADKESSISFSNIAATRMTCPNIEIENKVLQALNATKTFGKLENGNIALYNNGKQVLELTK